MLAAIWCIFGFAGLIVGAEILIRSGTRLAALIGIPPILIGLTVVSIGTSMPELAVGIDAALVGSGALAVGNIAGTNTFNILFILGLSALLLPLSLELRTIRIDLPVMIAAAVALVVMAWDGLLTRTDGAILFAAALVYTAVIMHGARRANRGDMAEYAKEYGIAPGEHAGRQVASHAALLGLSIVVIVIGADWLVAGAIDLARMLGVSEGFIGLTVVAIGTSSPELVTTVVSTLRRARDIAIGNLLGSSTYNILFILGATAVVPATGIEVAPALTHIDIPIMALVTLVCVPIFLRGHRVTRLEGGLFVAAYLAYLTYLLVART